MIINHYTPSIIKTTNKEVINVGSSDDNIKIIQLNNTYKNPLFIARKFEKWNDTFELQLLDDNSLKIRRSDVDKGGWGENLLVDVEHITENCTNNSNIFVNKEIIYAGTSDDNIKIIKLNNTYKNPLFTARKFEKWNDTFELQLLDDNSLKIRRSDVDHGGWGENLIIDVEFDSENIELYKYNSLIPQVIYQTFEKYEIPKHMFNAIQSWKDINPEYEHYYFSDDDRINFIEKYFDNNVLQAYLSIIPGAFKADLWRCCILYIKGGVYVDADMICLKPLKHCLVSNYDFYSCRDDPMSKSFIANGFIASIPNHPFLKQQIDSMVDNINSRKKLYYLDITGPGLLGKSINKICNRELETAFTLGENNINNYTFYLYKHKFETKTINICNDEFEEGVPIIFTEYNEKNEEMKNDNIPTFYSLYTNDILYKIIPREIYYTSPDYLSLNLYMIESFKKNKHWKLNYYNDTDVYNFFVNNNDVFLNELNTNVLDYYLTLKNGGEIADLWRYSIIYLYGGVYVDSDTFCNISLEKMIKHHDLILGVECFDRIDNVSHFGMDEIGVIIDEYVVSVCNWAFAAKPRHIFLKNLIIDICKNPIANDVLKNTGPGRITQHAVNYFSDCNLLLLKNENIVKEKSILFNINKFGSNQCHSGAYKNYLNPFDVSLDMQNDVYIIHMFDGTWRHNYKHKEINIYYNSLFSKYNSATHNLTITKTDNGYLGVSRLDKDTTRCIYMQQIGDCRSLNKIIFDDQFNIKSETECSITNFNDIAKFEDYRFFTFNNKNYYSVSYIDNDFNCKVAILDDNYFYKGDVNIDTSYNIVSFVGDNRKIWEKNWLFLEKNNELFFIYSTVPRYIVYKCVDFDNLKFNKFIDMEYTIDDITINNDFYYTASFGSNNKIALGGSTNPIFIKEKNIYMCLIHTKINYERSYNHYIMTLDVNLMPIKLYKKPLIHKLLPHKLLFIMSFIEHDDNYFVLSGGIEDKYNFTWQLSKEMIYKNLQI